MKRDDMTIDLSIMTPQERAQLAIDVLSSLIISNARMLASEQYNPGTDVDTSDDFAKERKLWVDELRSIRERLENLVTGVVL